MSFEPYASVVDVANLFFGRNQTLLLLTNQTQVLEHDFEHALVTVALLCKNILQVKRVAQTLLICGD